MDETALLKLPYIAPAQAQKHVTHNEALRLLDGLVHLAVLDRDLAEPPAEPVPGDRYIVPAGAGGGWSGQEGTIACWVDGSWLFFVPQTGWRAWIGDEAVLACWDGSAWSGIGPLDPPEQVALLGINTSADTGNRLSVASPATLLTHEGGGHQLKINKAAAGDIGSLLFQTGWSGRAEMGLAGNDDFSIKVSSDGSAWHTAMSANRATGAVSADTLGIGTSAPLQPLHVAGRSAFGDAVNATRLASGGGPRVLSLIDTAGVVRVWRRAVGGNAAVIEFAIGSGSDTISDSAIRWWQAGVIYEPERFDIGRRTGGGNPVMAISILASLQLGIGTTSPHASAHVDVASTTRGFLPPRMTTAQRNAIASPAAGLMLFNTDEAALQVHDGSGWRGGPHPRARTYAVSALPSAAGAGAGSIIFVSDEAGGATLAFSDGTDWRRVADRAVVS